MDSKEYIESGVLELYAYGQLNEAEMREVEGMCIQHSEVRAELEAIQSAVEELARAQSIMPPMVLKSKVLDQLQYHEPKVIQMHQPASSYRWLAAASVALFIFSAIGNVYLYNQYSSVTGQLADLRTQSTVLADNNAHLTRQITAVSNDLLVIENPNSQKIELAGLPLSPAAKALIYWDRERKETYINTSNLPPLAAAKQYQLWAIVDGRPVDLGMLSLDKQDAHLLKVKEVSAPQAFAITIEPAGGSINPTMDQMIVMGKL